MKLFFLTPSIKTGGGNRVFIELANILCDTNDISIIYPQNSSENNTFQRNNKIKFIGIGSFSESKIKKIFNLLQSISFINKKEYIDTKIVISDPIFCIFIPLIKNKKRVFRFMQSDDYGIFDDGKILGKGIILKLYKKLCLLSYNYRVSYIFNSKFVYDKFCLNSKRNDIPYRLVYPAINHSIFTDDRISESSKCSICLVARKHPLKGLITFINVFQKLPTEIKNKIGVITLISHDDLSDFNTEGMEIVKPECDNDIAHIYQKSDIFISTSWYEGFGLPPLEAMACGCAVITSKSGGVNEFAKENVNCLMFEPKNETELTEKLVILLNDENLRKTIAEEGAKTAKNFNWNKSALQLLEII